ncbi:hypothetical protein K0A97_00525 [Patescibacteria group bacterium]|nr:hypothetical protein [Patescibacteria group bacterium]
MEIKRNVQDKDPRIKRLESLLEYLVEIRCNGNRIRQLTKIIQNAYEQNPKELERYFNHSNKLISGIASSAYYHLTGDLNPLQELEYGGLGVTLTSTPPKLSFAKKQLWFSKITGAALYRSQIDDHALSYSEIGGCALGNSICKGNSLRKAKTKNSALRGSEIEESAGFESENTDHALRSSTISNYALFRSKNRGFSLGCSTIKGGLERSENEESSLEAVKIKGFSLHNAKMQNDFFKKTQIKGNLLKKEMKELKI